MTLFKTCDNITIQSHERNIFSKIFIKNSIFLLTIVQTCDNMNTTSKKGRDTLKKQDEENALKTLRFQVKKIGFIIQELESIYDTRQLKNVKKCLEDIILNDFHQTL